MRPIIYGIDSRNRRDKGFRSCTKYQIIPFIGFFTTTNRIFINDLNDGSRQAKSFGKKTDITVVLDKWLDKYESIEDIWPDYPSKDDFFFNEDEY